MTFVPGTSCDDLTPMVLLKSGEPVSLDEARAKFVLSEEDINIIVDLGQGNASATYWTCDLSHVGLCL